jgi:hypothetical protein
MPVGRVEYYENELMARTYPQDRAVYNASVL